MNSGTTFSTPTPPPPPGYPFCQWNLVWSKQTGTTYIPLIFAVDQYTSNTNFIGDTAAGVAQSSSTTLYFYASVGIETTEFIYEVSGESFYQSFSYNYTADGFDYEWPIAAIYVQGTLGTAEFVDSCNPPNYYAYEAYVQSANLSMLYTAHKVGTQYVSNALNFLNQYVGIVTVPFDEFDLSSAGQAYEYSYLYMQEYSQDYPFLYAIPVGDMILNLLSPETIPFDPAIEASLFAEVQTQSVSVTYSNLIITDYLNTLVYGDLLGIAPMFSINTMVRHSTQCLVVSMLNRQVVILRQRTLLRGGVLAVFQRLSVYLHQQSPMTLMYTLMNPPHYLCREVRLRTMSIMRLTDS